MLGIPKRSRKVLGTSKSVREGCSEPQLRGPKGPLYYWAAAQRAAVTQSPGRATRGRYITIAIAIAIPITIAIVQHCALDELRFW